MPPDIQLIGTELCDPSDRSGWATAALPDQIQDALGLDAAHTQSPIADSLPATW